MPKFYTQMTKEELQLELEGLKNKYNEFKQMNLKLDMSRGKPCPEQLDLAEELLTVIGNSSDCYAGDTDCRNYGVLDGIPEMKALFSEMMGIPAKNIIVGGSSSLSLMFDAISRAMIFGLSGEPGWAKQGKVKFLCPVPGYDRHFAICEKMGIEMINIEMNENGPDMDKVEALVSSDPQVKGIWCVPKYSNPGGIVYSDEVVKRLANLRPAAKDFRIFYDHAYAVHDLYEPIPQANLFEEAKKAGNEDICFIFASFAKISFAGGGVSMIAASDRNVADIKSVMTVQIICHDKVNQLRHVKYFKNAEGVYNHMKKHAEILRPKFEAVLNILEEELAPYGVGEWTKPKGGYFISLDLPQGCAKKTYTYAKEAGVVLTNAGASFPYGKDPLDRNIRIAPSYPSTSELVSAARVLCTCAKIAAIENLLGL